MKKFKVFTLMLAVITAMSSQVYAGEVQQGYSKHVKDKIALREFGQKQAKTKTLTPMSDNEINRLLTRMVMGTEVNKQEIESQLNNAGVYILETDSNIPTTLSDSSNVRMNTPLITYDSRNDEWLVSGGGYWANDSWADDMNYGVWAGYVGETKDMGGKDGFGVGYTNLSGNYQTYVVDQYAMISDGEGREVETGSRSDGDGSKGFGFELQDKVRLNVSPGSFIEPEECSYLGKHFGGTLTYDGDFTYFDGIATSYYVHTYEEAYISGVKFGVDGETAGVEISVANRADSFKAYSRDTEF